MGCCICLGRARKGEASAGPGGESYIGSSPCYIDPPMDVSDQTGNNGQLHSHNPVMVDAHAKRIFGK